MPKHAQLKILALALFWVVFVNINAPAACFDFPENQVPACGFETQDELDQWTIVDGTIELTDSPVHSGAGAALLHSSSSLPPDRINLTNCFATSGSEPMGYGIFVFPVTGPVSCMAHIMNCANSACTSCNPVGGVSSEIPTGEWTLVTFGESGTNGLPFAKFILFCGALTPSTSFEIVVDDAFFGEGMVPVTLQTMVIE